MKCLNCDSEKFEEKNLRLTPEIKGVEVEVVVPTFICAQCKTPLMDTDQMNVLRRAAADKYREMNHLLTSQEIIHFRTTLGMSQVAFANYLKVGEASIKRWETYFVQDVAQDEHMRLKCDEAYADFNALEVHWKSHMPDEYSGNRRFNLELFKQAVRYLVQFANSPLFLNKALFYADFKHFKEYKTSITGARYVPLEYGPCPDQYQSLFNFLLSKKILVPKGQHHLVSQDKPDLSVFDDSEKETLEFIAKMAQVDGGQKLLKLSHEEKGYKNTKSFQHISYLFAEELKI
jgi:putative zinc finger/helix-turn-helix YgiT family protein